MIPARLKPRLRSILLLFNLVLLALPLGGLGLLRIYESALVRQAETELVAQAAILAAAYRVALGDVAPSGEGWAPRGASLDLAQDPILPPPPEPVAPPQPAAADARAAGVLIAPILAEAQRITLAAMRVTDAQGVVVASSGGELGLSLAAMEEVAEALAGRPAARLRLRREGPVVAGWASISRPAPFRVFLAWPVPGAGGASRGAILLSRTPSSIGQAIYGKRWALLGLGAGLLLVAGLMAAVAGYTVARPIRLVAAQARAVAAGAPAPSARARRSAVREADELFAAIATIAGTLQSRADYIGAFAAEVSHEFKTPLAGLRGAIELLQEHFATMTEAERARFLDQCAGDVARLDLLTMRLLELARAEAPRAGPPESADPEAAARAAAVSLGLGFDIAPRVPGVAQVPGPVPGCQPEAVPPLGIEPPPGPLPGVPMIPGQIPGVPMTVGLPSSAPAAPGPPHDLSMAPGPFPRVQMAPETLRAVFALLFENARQHGGAGVRVRMDWATAPGLVCIRIADDGPGVAPADAGRIFERFFTTARAAGGTGLGLAIARGHAESAGGQLILAESARGACFELRLKPAGDAPRPTP